MPGNRRKTRFTHCFREKASVKDMIEALGVPHTEVDLLLVNGESVDFSHIVQDGDRISVYPVFESLDIRQVSRVRAEPLRDTRFVLDVHLGKLARKLRMLGFDAICRKDLTPDEIISISISQRRIILTKSRNLLKRKEITHGYCLNSSDPPEQLKLVIKRFDLPGSLHPFSRCMECNALLESLPAAEAGGRVPADVLERQREFKQCPACGRAYWNGSHIRKMREDIRALEKEAEIIFPN